MKILYVGNGAVGSNSTSMAHGFAALGHDVLGLRTDAIANPRRLGPAWAYKHAFGHRAPWTHARFAEQFAQARAFRPDVLFCFKTIHVPQQLLLSTAAPVTIHYSPDDVTNPDFVTPDYLAHEHAWDMVVTTKRHNVAPLTDRGARAVTFVMSAYDPAWHFRHPRAVGERHEVGFIGTARNRPGRMELLARLAETYGRRLLLAGEGWRGSDAAHHATMSPAVYGQDFAATIAAIRSNLVLLNTPDTHTCRSFEVPAAGGLVVGERTDEHEEMLAEGTEALYFDSYDELVEQLAAAAADRRRADRISEAGWRRITEGGNTYTDRAREILAAVGVS